MCVCVRSFVCDVCSLWCTMFAQWCVCIDLYVSLFLIDASGRIIVRTVICVFDNSQTDRL